MCFSGVNGLTTIETRTLYMFNWYTSDRNLLNFYSLVSSTNEETIYKIALHVEKLLRHFNLRIDFEYSVWIDLEDSFYDSDIDSNIYMSMYSIVNRKNNHFIKPCC